MSIVTEREIRLKYLALAKEGLQKLSDEYYLSLKSVVSKREAYKLVARHHQKCSRLIDKLSKRGLAEISQLPDTLDPNN